MHNKENTGSLVHTIIKSLAAFVPPTAMPIRPDCTFTYVDKTGTLFMIHVQKRLNSMSNLSCKHDCQLTTVYLMQEGGCYKLQQVELSMQHTDNSSNDPNLKCTIQRVEQTLYTAVRELDTRHSK